MIDIAVVGSANLDLVVEIERRPSPGETVFGSRAFEFVGGKGVNQALAAQHASSTAFVGAVGEDAAGDKVVDALAAAGVDVTHVSRLDRATGIAHIAVTFDGENSIIVVPGANALVSADTVTRSLAALDPSTVVVQLEISTEAARAAIQWAATAGRRVLVNASPVESANLEWLHTADPLVVNEHEAAALVRSDDAASADLAMKLSRYARSVVVTAGGRGSWIANGGTATHVPALSVSAIRDTTGAGDEFLGALASHLDRGGSLTAGVRAATRAAGTAITLERADR